MKRQLVAKGLSANDRATVEKVLAILQRHVGHENPIRACKIVEMAELTGGDPERDVQAIVKYLVEDMSVPIGTLTRPPYGFYIVDDEEELQENYLHFKRRAISNWKHAQAFRRPRLVGPIVGQGEIGDAP